MPSSPLHFFTICARNYAAHAATLAESIVRQYPEGRVTVWLLKEGPTPACLEGVESRDILEALPEPLYTEMRARYDVVEFCTAVKPRVFQQMFSEGAERVVYIDPDIYLYQPLTEVEKLLDEGKAGVLTAHSLSPIPQDGLGTDDYVLLMSGVFNLGFIALRNCPRSLQFLDWWWSWLQTHASQDHRTGLFTDQKWMGLAPAYWPELELTRHLGYNVAFWNLHERPLERKTDGAVTAGGMPLVFYHFSGYNPDEPERLAKYDHQRRFFPTEGSVLRELCDAYAERLRANGLEEARQILVRPVGYEEGYDGIAIGFFRSMLAAGGTPDFESLLEYIHGYDSGKAYPRYIEAILDKRPGIRHMNRGKNLAHIVRWLRDYGIKEHQLSPRIVESFVPENYSEMLREPKSTAPIAVLGMHRANTSMVSQMLVRLGVFLGPTSSFAAGSVDNQDGYWEDMRFHRISSEILSRFGGDWAHVPQFPENWTHDPRLADLAQDFQELLQSNAEHSPWGWKDPRACLTLPFFADHVDEMRLVITVRHPVEVAFSLVYRKYDNVTYEEGLELWFRHYQGVLPFLERFPSIVVHSESLRKNPAEELTRISQFLGLKVTELDISSAAGTVRPELRRSVPLEFKKLEDDLPLYITKMYGDLCNLSGPIYIPTKQTEPYTNLDDARFRIRQLEAVIAEKSADITGARRHLEHLLFTGQGPEVPEGSLTERIQLLEAENNHLRLQLAEIQVQVEAYANLRAVRVSKRLRSILPKR